MRVYVKVIPRSSKNEVIKIAEGEYKVKITAPPVDPVRSSIIILFLQTRASEAASP